MSEACLQMPPSLHFGIMSIPIEASQHGSELAVCQHKLTLRVMAVDENGNGLESNGLGHGYALAGA